MASTVTDPVVGNVCMYARFELAEDDDAPDDDVRGVEYTGRFSLLHSRDVPRRMKNQKLEMSVLSFLLNYRPQVSRSLSSDGLADSIRTWQPTRSTKRVIKALLDMQAPVPLSESKQQLGRSKTTTQTDDSDESGSQETAPAAPAALAAPAAPAAPATTTDYRPPITQSTYDMAHGVAEEPDMSTLVASNLATRVVAARPPEERRDPAVEWQDALDPTHALEAAYKQVTRNNVAPYTCGTAALQFVAQTDEELQQEAARYLQQHSRNKRHHRKTKKPSSTTNTTTTTTTTTSTEATTGTSAEDEETVELQVRDHTPAAAAAAAAATGTTGQLERTDSLEDVIVPMDSALARP